MKKTMLFGLIAIGLLAAPASPAKASGLCCQLSSGVQENISSIAAPAGEQFMLQLNYSFTRMDKFKEGTSDRSLDYLKIHSGYSILPVTMDMMKYTVTAGYGFTQNFKAFISVPYIRNTMDMTMVGMMGWMDMTMQPGSGLGDITAMGLYRFYANRETRPSEIATLGIGVKTPTGSFTETKNAGEFVHAHMQPGTGSWDPLLSVIYAKMMNPFLLQADATYQLTTRNRQGYEFGDSAAINVSGKYSVLKEFNITTAVTYLHTGKAGDKNGKYTNLASLLDDPANTGGNSIWISPGVQVLPSKNGLIDFKVQVPVWERVNGTQLVSDYRVLAGLSYSF